MMPETTIAELNEWAAERCGWTRLCRDGYGTLQGTSPEGFAVEAPPDYCGSLDAAWALAKDGKGFRAEAMKLFWQASDNRWYAWVEQLNPQVNGEAYGRNEAEALVRAVYAVNGHA